MPARRLCRFDELAEGEVRGFELAAGDQRFDLFVMRHGERVVAYENTCPHAGTPLDLLPDQFLSADRRHFQCHTHGALFRLDDGMCVAGPCRGRPLRRVAVRLEDGELVLDDSRA